MDNLNAIDLSTMDLSAITDYRTYETVLDMTMIRAVEDFVVIGYLLRRAEDTNILIGSRYKTVNEMAMDRYKLTPDEVCRYIAINKAFSENGYSPRLELKYRRFGIAKLQEMLMLPQSIIDELAPEMTRKTIQNIKKDYQQDLKTTDIEIMLEPKTAEMFSRLSEKTMYQYFHNNTDKYIELYTVACRTKYGSSCKEAMVTVMAPSGLMSDRIRLSGIGNVLITVDAESGVFTFTVMRSSDKDSMSADEMLKLFAHIFTPVYSKDAKLAWKAVYKEDFPEEKEEVKEEEVASVQNATSKTPAKPIKTESDKQSKKPVKEVAKPVKALEPEEVPDDVTENVEQKNTVEMPMDAINAECEEHFTPQKSTSTYRDTVFEEMAAVADKLQKQIKEQDIRKIRILLLDIKNMLDHVVAADESGDIIGQMSIKDIISERQEVEDNEQ